MEVLVNETIVIRSLAQNNMQKVEIHASVNDDEAESRISDSKYLKSKWCPLGTTSVNGRLVHLHTMETLYDGMPFPFGHPFS